ncbi:hypothetical protein ES703_77022 [subsurface metagenome]
MIPIKINMGTAARMNLPITPQVVWVNSIRPASGPHKKKAAPMAIPPRTKTIGTPNTKSTTREPIMSRVICSMPILFSLP